MVLKTRFLIILSFSWSLTSIAQNTWTQVASFPGTARTFGVGFSIGNKGYIGTGSTYINNVGQLYGDIWEYNAGTNAWTQKTGISLRAGAVAFSIGGKGYVGLGTTAGDFKEYDPVTDVWSAKAAFPGASRSGAAAFSIGNKGYIGLGAGVSSYTNELWEYDVDSNNWVQRASFPGHSRYGLVSFSIGNKGYVGTGVDSNNTFYNDFWEYNPATDTWTQLSNIGFNTRKFATGFSIGGKGYIGFGYVDQHGISGDLYIFDPATNAWTQTTTCGGNYTAYAPMAFSIGAAGYVVSGLDFSGSYRADAWKFNTTPTSISSPLSSAELGVSPNPSTGKFSIHSAVAITHYDVYNLIGETVYKCYPEHSFTAAEFKLNVPAGSYFLKVTTQAGIVTKQIIVTSF